MSAIAIKDETKPDTIEQKAERFIAKRREKYFAAVDNAKQAAETTATPAWQSNYREQLRFHRGVISMQSKTLESIAESLKMREPGEDDEKEINDAKKQLTDERIRWQAFLRRTTLPFSDTVQICDELRKSVMTSAHEAERDNPLVDNGLANEVRRIVAEWPKPEWNAESGEVTIKHGD